MLPMAAKHTNPTTGVLQERVCRATGAVVQVVDAQVSEAFDPNEGGRWVTYCCKHETFCQHDTKRLAKYHAADSATWCGMCAEGMD